MVVAVLWPKALNNEPFWHEGNFFDFCGLFEIFLFRFFVSNFFFVSIDYAM